MKNCIRILRTLTITTTLVIGYGTQILGTSLVAQVPQTPQTPQTPQVAQTPQFVENTEELSKEEAANGPRPIGVPPDMGPQPEPPIKKREAITPRISQPRNPKNPEDITWETIPTPMKEKLAKDIIRKPMTELSTEEKTKAVEFLKRRVIQGNRIRELILLEFDKDKNNQLSSEEKEEMKKNPKKVGQLHKQAAEENSQKMKVTSPNSSSSSNSNPSPATNSIPSNLTPKTP